MAQPLGDWWRKIKSFVWWSYPRASLEYDIMVGIILAFIFLVPRSFFHDQPRPFFRNRAGVAGAHAAPQVTAITLPHGHYYQIISRQPQDLPQLLARYTGHPVTILGQKTWRPSLDGPVIYGVWTR